MDHQEFSQDIACMGYQELCTEGLSQESSPQITKDVHERNVIVHNESSPPMTQVVDEKIIMTQVFKESHQESVPQTTRVFEKEPSLQKTSIFHQLSFP